MSKKFPPRLKTSTELLGESSFPRTEPWKVLRIMSEFVSAEDKLQNIRPAVSIFGSARLPITSPYYQLAQDVAEKLSNAGFSIFTGGGPGIMEAASKGGHLGKSPSIGLNIDLPFEQHHNPYLDVSVDFKYFFPRKYAFAKHASAFVAMPGGFGTLDELFEIVTLIQTHKMEDRPIILVGSSFWQGLLNWMDEQLKGLQLIGVNDLKYFEVLDDPDQIVSSIQGFYRQSDPIFCQQDITNLWL